MRGRSKKFEARGRPSFFYSIDYDIGQVGNVCGEQSRLHDRSLERAGLAQHRLTAVGSPRCVTQDPRTTLFICGLDEGVNEGDIRRVCGIYGEIVFVRIVRDAGKIKFPIAVLFRY